MHSDERIPQVLELLRPSMEQYRAAMAGTRAQMADYLAAHRGHAAGPAAIAATALGRFAGGRVDAGRFAAAFEGVRVLSPDDATRIERCMETLQSLAEAGDDLFVCEIPAGGDFISTVNAAFARLGTAFGAAMVFQVVKTQMFRETIHLPLLEAFPFERWNRPERLIAPPLVVCVDGADVNAASIANLLDGRMHIVLVVRGTMAPAALVGLITPGSFVMQTMDCGDVAMAIDASGPAISALVDPSSARFIHDPACGPRLADRLTVQSSPSEPPRRACGRLTVSQQRDQLAQLAALAAASAAEWKASATQAMGVAEAAATLAGSGPPADAVDTLAGWLLDQAGMMEEART